MSRPYISTAVLSAAYGTRFIPVDRRVFQKSKSEREGIKRMKKCVSNKGKMKTVVIFTCNDTKHGTFGEKRKRYSIEDDA